MSLATPMNLRLFVTVQWSRNSELQSVSCSGELLKGDAENQISHCTKKESVQNCLKDYCLIRSLNTVRGFMLRYAGRFRFQFVYTVPNRKHLEKN
jgi:hypothetical protein